MKRNLPVFVLSLLLLAYSCATPQYIFNAESLHRQKELRKSRSGHVFADIGLSFLSLVSLAALDTDLDLFPSGKEFKTLKLINPTADTIYINMLTDLVWDKTDYCDFMDIRIPPKKKCKVLVPLDAVYNLYYSNTPESEDDELLEIFTSNIKKVEFNPGLPNIPDSLFVN